MNLRIKNMTLSAMWLAVGMVLPFFTGQIQQIGSMMLPMHIPVLLCGLLCGWRYGLCVGFILPVLRSMVFGMPLLFPNAIAMAFELATYGFVIGLIYHKSKRQCMKLVYISMIVSMIAGRVVWAVVQIILLGIGEGRFTFEIFLTGALFNAIPGIIIQLIIIPMIMVALDKTNIAPFKALELSHSMMATRQ